MIPVKGIKLSALAAVLSIVAIGLGIWFAFFHSRGFIKTTATIVDVELEDFGGADDGPSYSAIVEYSVDGVTYREKLDSRSSSYKVGKNVTVLYDPNDPSVVHSSGTIGIYFIVVGVLILTVLLVSAIREKAAQKELKELKESRGETIYEPSGGGEERKLYFLTDLGTAKYGHRIEDEAKHVLYEAKMTKFTAVTPYGFDFIDHEHGRVSPHLIGHEESSEWDTPLFDNHYTFTYDGEDVWNHLKRNGIHVESSLNGPRNGSVVGTNYRIYRDGQEIAYVESSGKNVHEEDAVQQGVFEKLLPMRGFYRIQTRETNLELLFVVLLAFARSGANDGRGGTRGAILGTLRNQSERR